MSLNINGEIRFCINESEYIKKIQLKNLEQNPELQKAHDMLESLLSILKPLDIFYEDYWDIAVNLKRQYKSLDVDSIICRMFQWFDYYHITNYKKQHPCELSFLNFLMHLNCFRTTEKEYLFFPYDLFALFIERLEKEIKIKSKNPFKTKKLLNDYIAQLNHAKKLYTLGIIDVLNEKSAEDI